MLYFKKKKKKKTLTELFSMHVQKLLQYDSQIVDIWDNGGVFWVSDCSKNFFGQTYY